MTVSEQTPPQERLHQLLLTLGKSYLARQQYAEAHEKLTQLLALTPEVPEVISCATMASIGLKDVSEEALGLYEKAVQANPDSDQLVFSLAALFEQQNVQTEFAAEICKRARGSAAEDDIHRSTLTDETENGATREKNAKAPELAAKDECVLFQTFEAYLENLWWQGNFSEANRILLERIEQADNKERCTRQIALTHAYEHLSKNRNITKVETAQLVASCASSIASFDSIEDVRDYLTLRLVLPNNFTNHTKDPENSEFLFILGKIAVEDFFNEIQNDLSNPGRDLSAKKFNLNGELLARLKKTEAGQEDQPYLPSRWRCHLFAQPESQHSKEIPEGLLKLMSAHLSDVPESVLRYTNTGFLGLATDPAPQINALVKLLQSLESYNAKVSAADRISLHCSIVITKGKCSARNTLKALVYAAHLLRVARQRADTGKSAGTILFVGDKKALQRYTADEIGLMPMNEVDILPGEKIACNEIIWRTPLAHLSNKTGYCLGDIEVKACLLQHRNYATYLGMDKRLGRHVILKALSLSKTVQYLQNEDQLERIYETIRAVGRMSHPNIATLFDMGEQDYVLFYAREYLDGRNITEVDYADSEWEIDFLTNLLTTVRALIYLHSQGVSHLNLKPGNIWLTEAQGLKITDFRHPGFESPSGSSQTPMPEGWEYTAPEILMGKKSDIRSDIYSLGTIAYEVLARRHPYEKTGKIKRPQDLLKVNIVPLEKAEHPPHEAWGNVIMTAIQADADKRFQTLHDLDLELRKIQIELNQSA